MMGMGGMGGGKQFGFSGDYGHTHRWFTSRKRNRPATTVAGRSHLCP